MPLKLAPASLGLLANFLLYGLFVGAPLLHPVEAMALDEEETIVGLRLRLGWKYDDLRVCGATAPGSPHGPEIDIAFFTDLRLDEDLRLDINLPLMRPMVFGFQGMLQLEPEATLVFEGSDGRSDWGFGPSLGLSLHYGPDLHHDEGSPQPFFFALGPRLGAYLGYAPFEEGEDFGYELGLHAFVTPLFAVGEPGQDSGWVAGASLDHSFRFNTP